MLFNQMGGKMEKEKEKEKSCHNCDHYKSFFFFFKERKKEKERKKQYKIINSANQQLCKSKNAVRRLIIQQMFSCNQSTTTLYITLMADWALKINYQSGNLNFFQLQTVYQQQTFKDVYKKLFAMKITIAQPVNQPLVPEQQKCQSGVNCCR